MNIGIDAAAYFVPSLYLPIKTLAEQRNIDPAKLEKGLGLKKMAFPDVHEDAATFAAEAVLKLIMDYHINPQEISRIYMGTESALDAAKPTATYALHMVEQVLEKDFGKRCFKHCDAVDLTFACIGAVDALHNCIDYVRANPTKKAVVIASDYAKYELQSSGEYTQGAGAVAVLITAEPRLLTIQNHWGIATDSVFDFFKPRRTVDKSELNNAPELMPEKIEIFSDEPVFDGQYSNQCYQDRIREAYQHYQEQTKRVKPYENWRFLIFHLPYAFHGKRLFTEIYGIENGLPVETSEDIKSIAQTEGYKKLVTEKIETSQKASSEIGNMYTASIFMALLSAIQCSYQNKEELAGKEIGFLSYGSGSKSKVFTANIGQQWKEIVEKWNIFDMLEQRTSIDFSTYNQLHRKQLSTSYNANWKGFGLTVIEKENPNSRGSRYYEYR